MARILIVDDLAEIRLFLRITLRSAGHTLVEAANGVEALALGREEAPDLVISDGLMPEMDGFRLCLEMRRDPALSTVPFIFYTASFAREQDSALAQDLGAAAYLLKPTDPQKILETVARVLAEPKQPLKPLSDIDETVALLERYGETIETKLDSKVAQLTEARGDRDTLRALLDNLPLLVVTFDTQLRPDYLNRASARFFGIDSTSPESWDWTSSMSAEDVSRAADAVEESANTSRSVELTLRIRRHDGQGRLMRLSLTPYRGSENQHLGVLLAGVDVTEAEEHAELLRFLAEHDVLTGLPNRRVLDVRFEEVLRRLGGGETCALLFIAVEGLKTVNDTFGHDAGDMVLTGIARLLSERAGEGDLVVRLCGDEFVWLAENASEASAFALAEEIRTQVASTRLVQGAPGHRITVNIGVNLLPETSAKEGALHVTDDAMHLAKVLGVNQTRKNEVSADDQPALSVLNEIVATQAPELEFVSVYSLATGRLVRCSARPCFKYDDDFLLPNDEVMVVAARHGIARRLEELFMERVLTEISNTGTRCSMRLSLANVLDPNVFERVERQAMERGIDPALVSFAVPSSHLLRGTLPPTWLQAAARSPIGLVLDCRDVDPAAVVKAAHPPFTEAELPGSVFDLGGGPAHSATRSLIDMLLLRGLTLTITDLDDDALLESARQSGAQQGSGSALVNQTEGGDRLDTTASVSPQDDDSV